MVSARDKLWLKKNENWFEDTWNWYGLIEKKNEGKWLTVKACTGVLYGGWDGECKGDRDKKSKK